MGRQYEAFDESLISWISTQPLFFVGTAPNAPDGHVNISPKGSMQTFRILGPTTVAYLDLQGSGIETVAHLGENGRIVVMFCAFDGPPKIVRLHGRGRVVDNQDPGFADLVAQFAPSDEIRSVLRSVIVVEVTRISDSCGFVVPRMEFVEERSQLFRWAENKQRTLGAGWEAAYRRVNNCTSIDGLPGLDIGDNVASEEEALNASGRAL
jgi:hypothetical protein